MNVTSTNLTPNSLSTTGNIHSNKASPSHHSLNNEQMYSLGNAAGNVFRHYANSISEWWNRPSPEQIKINKQRNIFRLGLQNFRPRLSSALDNLYKNPNDPGSLKRIEKLVSENPNFLKPSEREDFQKIQNQELKQLNGRVATLESKLKPKVLEKLGRVLPILFKEKNQEKTENPPENSVRIPQKIEKQAEVRTATTCPITSVDDPRVIRITVPLPLGNSDKFNIISIGDIKGDGQNALLICDPFANGSSGLNPRGKCWVLFGGQDFSKIDLNNLQSNQGFVLYGTSDFEEFGTSATPVGNYTGNGKNAVAIGGTQGGLIGRVFVAFDLSNPIDFSNCNGSNNCIWIDGKASTSVSFGSCLDGGKKDYNGDGYDDFVAGDGIFDEAYVFYGGPNPTNFNTTLLSLSKGITVKNSGGSGGGFGCPVSIGKNEQGITKVLVSEPGASLPGQNSAGKIFSINGTDASASLIYMVHGQTSDLAGYSITYGGDLDRNGKTDINIGTNANNGKVYVLYEEPDPSTFPINVGALNGNNGGTILQQLQAFSRFGSSTATINVKGNSELVVGMPLYNPPGGSNGDGAILVLEGQSGGFPQGYNLANSSLANTIKGTVSGGNFGKRVSNLGSINGASSDSIGAVAASGNTGYAYIIPGDTSICPTTTTTPSSTTTSAATTAPSSNTGLIIGLAVGLGFASVAALVGTVVMKIKGWGCFAGKKNKKVVDSDNVLRGL